MREHIANTENEIYLSAASSWEMVIKYQLGKLRLDQNPRIFIPEQLAKHEFHSLEVSTLHVLDVGELPLHHKDPFDRMLVVQSNLENIPLITSDPVFKKYDVELVWAK